MPNGKPGDHPFTDLVVHGAEVFGAEIDGEVRRLARSLPPPLVDVLVELVAWWPAGQAPHGVAAMLRALDRAGREIRRNGTP